jgi:universal stress protein E
MSNFKRLLLVASPDTRRTPAFERAVALARASGAVLHIVAVDYVEALSFLGLFNHEAMARLRDGYLQLHRHWLEQEADYERKRGLEVIVQMFWTHQLVEDICQYAGDIKADLVIKDVHRESTLKRLFFTPLDWHLLRDCSLPIHLVTDHGNPLPRKVLAAVNLYREKDADLRLNDVIVEAAAHLAKQCDAELHLVYVYDWSAIYASGFTLLGAMPVETGFAEALTDAHLETFQGLAKRHAVPKAHAHFLTGVPLPCIKAFAAENKFDVLVMGTLPHHTLDRILGDTAESLLQHAPCSALIVHAAGEGGQVRN